MPHRPQSTRPPPQTQLLRRYPTPCTEVPDLQARHATYRDTIARSPPPTRARPQEAPQSQNRTTPADPTPTNRRARERSTTKTTPVAPSPTIAQQDSWPPCPRAYGEPASPETPAPSKDRCSPSPARHQIPEVKTATAPASTAPRRTRQAPPEAQASNDRPRARARSPPRKPPQAPAPLPSHTPTATREAPNPQTPPSHHAR